MILPTTHLKKRKILIVTERRADYSRLKPIMQFIEASPKLELQLIVTGMHLLHQFGHTVDVIKKDGFQISAQFPTFTDTDFDDGASMVKAMGKALLAMPDIFNKLKPDLIFAGFDIGANFAAAVTGMHLNIIVSHIQGGEVSGTIDEVIRHALTKFAHIHFAATRESQRRIIKLGEDPKYVFLVGSPSIDTIRSLHYPVKSEIFKLYDLDPNQRFIILLQHPVTSEIDSAVSQINTSISALKKISCKYAAQVLAVYSNNDAGGKRIVENLVRSGIKVVPHIVFEDFLRLMKVADVLVGNSSAGIHEAPSFGLPTVNIGTRQQHRERGKNVINVNYNEDQIYRVVETALTDKSFIRLAKSAKNPYDQGETAKKVVKILETIKFPPIQKVITY